MKPLEAPSRLRGHELFTLVLAACVAAAVAGVCAATAVLPWFNDAFMYMSLAEHLARGEGYRSSTFMLPDLIQPPLYPMVIAAGLFVTRNALAVAVAVQCGCVALSVVGLVQLHRWLWGNHGWVFTAVIASCCPVLGLSGMLASEPVFCCLLIWSFTLAIAGYKTQSPGRAAVSALLAGLSVLTRPEGLALAVLVIALPLCSAGPPLRRGARAAIALGVVASVLTPYALFTHAHLGYYTLTPKADYNVTLAELLQDIEWRPDQAGIRARDARIISALMPDHRNLVLTEKFLHPEIDVRPLFPLRTHHPIRALLRSLPGALRLLLWMGVKRLGLLHPAFVALSAFAFVRGFRAARFNWPLLALVALIAVNLIPSVLRDFIMEARFLAAATLLCAPLIGRGASLLIDFARDRLPSTPGWTRALPIGVGLALIGVSLPPLVALAGDSGSGGDHTAMVEAGKTCVHDLPQGARIASLNVRCPFLVNGTHFLLPYVESLGELTSYLDQNDVEFVELNVDDASRHVSPVIRALTTQAGVPGEWTLIGDPLAHFRLFRIRRARLSAEPSRQGAFAVDAAGTRQ
jgi:hypothetical protein